MIWEEHQGTSKYPCQKKSGQGESPVQRFKEFWVGYSGPRKTEKYKVATQAEAGYTKRHQGTEIKNLHKSIKLIEGQNECSYLSLHLKRT